MYGRQSCGRRVSLLNETPSTPPVSHLDTFDATGTRPKQHNQLSREQLSDRFAVRFHSFSSTSSSPARSSPCSSGHPSHSPPTPPLSPLPSPPALKSLTRPSMNPSFGFQSTEQRQKQESTRSQQRPPSYYHILPRGASQPQNGFSPIQTEATQNPYYISPSPNQSLHELDFDPRFQQQQQAPHLQNQRALHPIQTQLEYPPPPQSTPLTASSPYTAHQTPSSSTNPHHLSYLSTPASATSQITSHTQLKPSPTTTTTSASTTSAHNPPLTHHEPASSASQRSQTPSSSSNSKSHPATIGKKKYPCPFASRYACTDTFTTSGHAARHGKKHTGEKNITCPTCGKAFTRKDNMKQHERTHKGGSIKDVAGGTAGGKGRKGSASEAMKDRGEEEDSDVKMTDTEMSSPTSQHPHHTAAGRKQTFDTGGKLVATQSQSEGVGNGIATPAPTGGDDEDGEGDPEDMDVMKVLKNARKMG